MSHEIDNWLLIDEDNKTGGYCEFMDLYEQEFDPEDIAESQEDDKDS